MTQGFYSLFSIRISSDVSLVFRDATKSENLIRWLRNEIRVAATLVVVLNMPYVGGVSPGGNPYGLVVIQIKKITPPCTRDEDWVSPNHGVVDETMPSHRQGRKERLASIPKLEKVRDEIYLRKCLVLGSQVDDPMCERIHTSYCLCISAWGHIKSFNLQYLMKIIITYCVSITNSVKGTSKQRSSLNMVNTIPSLG